MAQEVKIENLNQGGIADSDYVGGKNSVSELVNCDIHSEAGIVKCNQALTKASGSTVTEFIQASTPCSNGSSYHFGASGGIYEREAGGTWTKRGTASPAAGAAGILSAKEYQGYIYYAMQNRLGRFAIPTAGAAITQDDNWATFTNGDVRYHPMRIVNQVLYIGDAQFVAQVDAGVFSANALDIKEPLRISALGRLDTDLLIGTFINNNVMETEILRWNTWSVSFSVTDPIPEVGVNAFLDSDNVVLVNAGKKGNLYLYDGAQLEPYKQVKGDYSAENKAVVRENAVFNFNGMPLFGMSQDSGTGVLLGVYSIARTNRNYPFVLNLEHTISTGNTENITIGSICPISADQFLVSWQDDNGSTSYGVDVLDLTAKATGYFMTRVMQINRQMDSEWGYGYAGYRTLPTDTAINMYRKVNSGALSSALETVDDIDRNLVYTKEGIGDAATLQMKTELVPSGNDSPELEQIIYELPND